MQDLTRRQVLSTSKRLVAAAAMELPVVAEPPGKPENRLKVVVVGGHPDDPECGCGGTMARYASLGHTVAALYLTRGEAGIIGKSHAEAASIRTREARKACDLLGARAVFAGQVNGAAEINAARYQEFHQLLSAEQPDIVFAHWPIDTHPDHRAASLLAYHSFLISSKKFSLYYFEVMTGSQSQNFIPTNYVDITATVGKKQAACYAHQSQKPETFYPVHAAMQEFRGRECGCKAAEAFVRQVRSPNSLLETG